MFCVNQQYFHESAHKQKSYEVETWFSKSRRDIDNYELSLLPIKSRN